MASPDINTEDFQAAVDFLSVQDNVDPERIGIIGICGWGNPEHIAENYDVFDFELSDAEMVQIAALDRQQRYESW